MSQIQSGIAGRYFKMKSEQFRYGVAKAKRMKEIGRASCRERV